VARGFHYDFVQKKAKLAMAESVSQTLRKLRLVRKSAVKIPAVAWRVMSPKQLRNCWMNPCCFTCTPEL